MLDKNTIPPVVIEPGTYGSVEIEKRISTYILKHSGVEWNTYNERYMREYHEQWSGYDLAYGDVLLSGLGFGQMATWVAAKPKVNSVTVLELSQDILDAFLANNKLPEKVTVLIEDANTFSSNKKYDSVIFDHISNNWKDKFYYTDFCNIANRINCDLFWFWSIEAYYLKYYYDINVTDFFVSKPNLKELNIYSHWKDLLSDLNNPAIPLLDESKVLSYIKSFTYTYRPVKRPK